MTSNEARDGRHWLALFCSNAFGRNPKAYYYLRIQWSEFDRKCDPVVSAFIREGMDYDCGV